MVCFESYNVYGLCDRKTEMTTELIKLDVIRY